MIPRVLFEWSSLFLGVRLSHFSLPSMLFSSLQVDLLYHVRLFRLPCSLSDGVCSTLLFSCHRRTLRLYREVRAVFVEKWSSKRRAALICTARRQTAKAHVHHYWQWTLVSCSLMLQHFASHFCLFDSVCFIFISLPLERPNTTHWSTFLWTNTQHASSNIVLHRLHCGEDIVLAFATDDIFAVAFKEEKISVLL